MSALPSIENVGFDEDGISAYRLVLSAEAAALQEPCSSEKYNDNLIGARVLGWLLKDLWDHSDALTLAPFKRLVHETKACCNDVHLDNFDETEVQHEKIYSVGLTYRNHLMLVFRCNAGPRPALSRRPSRPSFDNHKHKMLLATSHVPQTKAEVKALVQSSVNSSFLSLTNIQQALHRDGYKCMLEGGYDLISCEKFPELTQLADSTGATFTGTECVHLFSERAEDAGKEYTATAFTILKLFQMNDVVDKILGGEVNSPFNVLTLDAGFHTWFDSFWFWLEEVSGQPNTYDVVAHDPIIFRLTNSPPRRVTFQVDSTVVAECERNKTPLPDLPSRKLIAIRAACARVAHASGAVEQAEQITEDREMISVLATDGSNADLLSALLTRSASGVEVNGQS